MLGEKATVSDYAKDFFIATLGRENPFEKDTEYLAFAKELEQNDPKLFLVLAYTRYTKIKRRKMLLEVKNVLSRVQKAIRV